MLMFKFNILLCLSILSVLCFGFVKSVCVLQYPDDIAIAPIYTKYFGRYALQLPYTRSRILLQNDETIYAKCQTTFSLTHVKRSRYSYNSINMNNIENQTNITVRCVGNTLYFKDNILEDNVLKCEKLNWSIYEDNKIHSWCKMDTGLVAPLILATKSNLAHHILAEICFNLNDWSLQTITYNVTIPNENVENLRDIAKTELQAVDFLGENLWNLKSTYDFGLMVLDLESQLEEMSQHNSWLHLANYELSPIVQGKSYESYFKEYSNILNTIWWSNLRLGNWKRFMETLENYAYNNSFQLYSGTSGAVRKPLYNMADLSKDLTIKFDFKHKPVPAYIWTYLTSTDKTNKDFIIVGYNSPYAEFFPRKEIVFCPDICEEIPWLTESSESFKFNTAGIMFCCSPESIQQTNILNGFPINVLISRTNTSTIGKEDNNDSLNEVSTLTTTTTQQTTTTLNTKIYSTTVVYNEIISEELSDNDVEERNYDEIEENEDNNDY